jgi:hypothetical protein
MLAEGVGNSSAGRRRHDVGTVDENYYHRVSGRFGYGAAPMHPDGYFALVLTEESSVRLVGAFATLSRPIAHHCTVKYGTSNPADLPPAFAPDDVGKTFLLAITGFKTRDDGGVQAVVVSLVRVHGGVVEEAFSENAIPHVTVATDGVTEPAEANAMLAQGFDPVLGPTLTATLVHTRASSGE